MNQLSFKLLQIIVIIGVLAGCATESQSNMGMDSNKPMCSMCMDKMESGEMSCCKSCCSCCKGMKDMSGKMMCMESATSKKNGKKNSKKMSMPANQADDGSHAEHHPAGSE